MGVFEIHVYYFGSRDLEGKNGLPARRQDLYQFLGGAVSEYVDPKAPRPEVGSEHVCRFRLKGDPCQVQPVSFAPYVQQKGKVA